MTSDESCIAHNVRFQLSPNCQGVFFVVRLAFPVGFKCVGPGRGYTGTRAPVVNRFSGLASQRIVAATSAGLLQRATTSGGLGIALRLAGVSMIDGTTALTRTPALFNSSASARVSATTPAFEIV